MRKRIFLITIIASAVIFSHNLFSESYDVADVSSCFDSECGDFTSGSKPITLPQFPGCTITVDYQFRSCNGKIEMFIEGWTLGTNCNSVWDYYWDMGSPFPDPTLNIYKYLEVRNWIEDELLLTMFEDFYNELEPIDRLDYQCGGTSQFRITATRAKCESVCWYWDELRTHPIQIGATNCSIGECCIREWEMCWNDAHQRIEKTLVNTTITGGGLACEENTPIQICEPIEVFNVAGELIEKRWQTECYGVCPGE